MNTRFLAAGFLSFLMGGAVSAQQPEPQGIDPAVWMDGVRAAYRDTLVHEQHTITVIPPGGDPTSAQVVTRTVATEGGSRTWVRLGPFDVLIEPGRAAVIHRHNRKTVLMREGGSGLGPLFDVVPRIPLPQIEWLVGGGESGGAALSELQPLGSWFEGLVLERVSVGPDGLATTAVGALVDDRPSVEVRVDESNRVVDFTARVATEEGPVGEMRIISREIDKEPVPEWAEFVAGREAVASLALLKAEQSQIPAGTVMPGLGFMTGAMEGWDHEAVLKAAEASHPGSRQLFAMVVYDAGKPASVADAAGGFVSAYRAGQQLRRQSAVDARQLPHLILVPVGVVGVDDFRPDALKQREAKWAEVITPLRAGDPGAAHVWTSVGPEVIGRFVPDSAAVVVVTDATLRILAVIPLDGRASDNDALAREIAGSITE